MRKGFKTVSVGKFMVHRCDLPQAPETFMWVLTPHPTGT